MIGRPRFLGALKRTDGAPLEAFEPEASRYFRRGIAGGGPAHLHE